MRPAAADAGLPVFHAALGLRDARDLVFQASLKSNRRRGQDMNSIRDDMARVHPATELVETRNSAGVSAFRGFFWIVQAAPRCWRAASAGGLRLHGEKSNLDGYKRN